MTLYPQVIVAKVSILYTKHSLRAGLSLCSLFSQTVIYVNPNIFVERYDSLSGDDVGHKMAKSIHNFLAYSTKITVNSRPSDRVNN